jgi:hypothetical protein
MLGSSGLSSDAAVLARAKYHSGRIFIERRE